MAVNKVIYGGNTLVDLTGDTVTAADLADGVKATGSDGNPIVGLMQKVTIDAELSTTSTNPVQNKVIKAELDKKIAKTDKIYEANLEWGDSDLLDRFSPIDAAMVPELGSDHFCFFPPSNVDIEYSIDGGKTWLDYGLTIDQKWKLFSQEADYAIGKCTSNNQSTDNLLRITMRAAGVIYTQIKKFIFYISTNGSHQSYVTIETQKDGSDFKAYGGKHYLEGWSGYTVVNFEIIREQSVAGNDFRFGTTRYCNADTIRFTFGHEGFADNNPYKGLTVKRIMAFGGTCWTAPSNMATNGHLYSYNYMKESLFPATVTAPNFIGKVNGYTISASVPANAKFTDTVYTHPATHPASMITGLSAVATSGSYNDLSDKPTIVKTVNNVAPDSNGNVDIAASGGVTVDAELSSTSNNPVQNKVIYDALQNKIDADAIFSGFALIGGESTIAWRQGSQPIGSINATNYTGTAARATQDGAGNVITETYVKKADISGVVKSVNGTKPDTDGNVVIDVSGGGGGSGAYLPLTGGTVTGGITAPNFQTGTGANNYFQCRKFRGEGNADTYYHAIDFGYSGHDSVDFYEYDPNWNFYKCLTGTKSGAVLVGNINGNGWNGGARLTGAPTAPTAAVGTNTTQIATTAFVQSAIPTNVSSFTNDAGYIKSVNNTKPDSNGNVTITVSGGGGVSTSESNTWTGKQTFQKMKFNFESYNAPRISGATDNPSSSVAVYNVQGNFTLDMSTLAGLLSNGDATVFTAYITANGSYTLSITNAGTLKYAGSATDLAITANGLLLNIMLIKSSSGVLSSVAQASTLS
jgi:hypothetical protein